MSNRNSIGFGAGFSVPTAGANIVLSPAAANFVIENTDGANPVYVMLNAVLYTDNTYVTPVTGVFPTLTTPTTSLGVSKTLAATVLSRGIKIAAGQSKEFKGFAPFNGGAQLINIAIVASGGAVTVTGGQTDVST